MSLHWISKDVVATFALIARETRSDKKYRSQSMSCLSFGWLNLLCVNARYNNKNYNTSVLFLLAYRNCGVIMRNTPNQPVANESIERWNEINYFSMKFEGNFVFYFYPFRSIANRSNLILCESIKFIDFAITRADFRSLRRWLLWHKLLLKMTTNESVANDTNKQFN